MAGAGQLYQDQILDHYKHPRNRGTLDPSTHQATEVNPLCGDKISLRVRLGAGGRIEAARFDGQGCAISIASASMLTTLLEGKDVRDAKSLDEATLLRVVGVPLSAVRKACALLSLQALRAALAGHGDSR